MRIGIFAGSKRVAAALREVLAMMPEHNVGWVAERGEAALRLAVGEGADLILVDLSNPAMDAGAVISRIMEAAPCAILLVAASIEEDAARVFEAMGRGAIDAVDFPLAEGGASVRDVAILRGKISRIGQLVGPPAPRRPAPAGAAQAGAGGRRLIAIGASAGGPGALATLLSRLPPDFPASVVIVQHVDEKHARGLAEWLCGQCALPVRLAEEGDAPAQGRILVAGGGRHLTLRADERLGYTDEPQGCLYRPSIDVFFNSLNAFWRGRLVGVLLTGMGRDGAAGLKTLRLKGHHTIAQDEASSAVYGMPKAAAALAAAVETLPLERIAARLVAACAPNRLNEEARHER